VADIGLGEIGINGGQIFTNWDLSLLEPPEEARLERHGLDYGYTNDLSALVDIYGWNGEMGRQLLRDPGASKRDLSCPNQTNQWSQLPPTRGRTLRGLIDLRHDAIYKVPSQID
jgi:hypothetical protein